MACQPTSRDSLAQLRNLIEYAEQRNDRCLAVLLTGVELYVAAGREMELLELMRERAEDFREAVENTPTAQDLRRLFELE
jgi:hypothetical protein